MKLIFGLNIILHVEVIDKEVGYAQDLFINVHNIHKDPVIMPNEQLNRIEIFAEYEGETLRFKNFNEIAKMDKRRLLALRKLTVILS